VNGPPSPQPLPFAAATRAAGRRVPTPSRRRPVPDAAFLARRRLMVAVAKRALPALALALLASIALWPEIEGAADRGRVAFKRVLEARPDALRVVAPRFQGIDDQNRPYTVTAALAVQAGDDRAVTLDAPRGDITLSDGAWVHVEARQGRYDQSVNRLDLAGEVTLNHEDGTQLITEAARFNLRLGHGEGDRPVAAQGPFGTLTSEGFRLEERGQVVVFTGRARALLEAR